jgi:hypothetical protein
MSDVQKSVSGGVRTILRLEGLSFVVTSCLVYRHAHYSWAQFLLFLLLPDLSFAGYLAGPKIGAGVYNAAHTYVTPITIGIAFYLLNIDTEFRFLLIWMVHIGFDRALGCGLKYDTGFGETHLGKIGKSRTLLAE